MELSRRGIFAMTSIPFLASVPLPAIAAPRKTTYVISPHPDDETIRGCAQVRNSLARGDRLVLVAVGSGGGSNVGTKRGWSDNYEMKFRTSEQAAAWSALTDTYGSIIRFGYLDGAFSTSGIQSKLAPIVKNANPGDDFYAACHPSDYHLDHRKVARALKQATEVRGDINVRYMLSNFNYQGVNNRIRQAKVNLFDSRPEDVWSCEIASDAYRDFGQVSVIGEFRALWANNYRTIYTR